uniref:Phosphoinositide phospholipase C n=1 Tax=Trichuris muris TaxID=70415 RepID=A0A5S6Q9V1_TRIMR
MGGQELPNDMHKADPSVGISSSPEASITAMEKGHRAVKVMLNRKVESSARFLRLQRLSRQVLFYKTDNVWGKGAERPFGLSLHTIKDVHSLDHKLNTIMVVEKWRQKEMVRFDPNKVLLIYHGSEFVLQLIVVILETYDACSQWVCGLNVLRKEGLNVPHPLIIDRWLRREFFAMANPVSMTVPMKLMKPFIQQRLQCRISSKALLELTNDVIDFEAFVVACRRLTYSHQLFSNAFFSYSEDGQIVSVERFQHFLRWEQKDEMGKNSEQCYLFLRNYLRGLGPSRATDQPYLSVQEFLDYLFSRENGLLDPVHKRVNQDMTRPLCDYWISSSHNTYLTGDQLTSESSLEAYTKALLMNCRCVELDCWDGQKRGPSDLEIVVYHGHTMTTKLNLRDVLYTIRAYAFVASEYPLILSIEDNCTLPFQRQLASDLKDVFQDMLLTTPLDSDATELPSPEQLKRKILIKHKKLPVDSDGRVNSSTALVNTDDPFQDNDLLSNPDVQKKGVLYMKEKDGECWYPHLFILLPDRLCYYRCARDGSTFRPGDEESTNQNPNWQLQPKTEEEKGPPASEDIAVTSNPDELHMTEEWFHGRIRREQAVRILEENQSLGNGLFLVRESTTFVGDYSLSLLHSGLVHHCRIKSTQIAGVKHYYLLETKKMDTLYQLIGYYQKQPLITPKFRSKLRTPCPQPCPHVGEPWFAGDIDKQKAEEMLNQYPLDGAFLIRSGDKTFILSFRVDGLIKHCRLKHEGRLFVVGDHQFESLNWVVEYYSKNELYRGICLKYPVNAETIEKYSSELSNSPVGSYLELNGSDKCVALTRCAYTAQSDIELSFPAKALIIIHRKENELWWRASYCGKVGLVLMERVEILHPTWSNDSRTASQEVEVETLPLTQCLVEVFESSKPFSLRICEQAMAFDGRELVVAASSQEDQIDWLNSIMEVSRCANNKASLLRSKEKCLRIASELSNLVVYCQAVPFNPDRIPGKFYEMCSFCDSKLDRLVEKGLVRFNRHQLSRVYPNGARLTSSNFNPVPMWNTGCQMVALNYQTPDKYMQLSQAKFMVNGNCGYVLKPDFLLCEQYDPEKPETICSSKSMILTVEVIAGRHLYRKDKSKGIVSPVVEVEVIGLPCDCRAYRTSVVCCDGLHPVWNEHFEFDIKCPELAFIRFYVEDGDLVYPSTEPVIAQATFPVNCIRSGYRSVTLRNEHSEELELSALLLHVDIQYQGQLDSVQVCPAIAQVMDRLNIRKESCTIPSSSSCSIMPRSISLKNLTTAKSNGALHTSPSANSLRKKISSSSIKKFLNMHLKRRQIFPFIRFHTLEMTHFHYGPLCRAVHFPDHRSFACPFASADENGDRTRALEHVHLTVRKCQRYAIAAMCIFIIERLVPSLCHLIGLLCVSENF